MRQTISDSERKRRALYTAYCKGKEDGYHYALSLIEEIASGTDCAHAHAALVRELKELERQRTSSGAPTP